jgi:hypothetical protein
MRASAGLILRSFANVGENFRQSPETTTRVMLHTNTCQLYKTLRMFPSDLAQSAVLLQRHVERICRAADAQWRGTRRERNSGCGRSFKGASAMAAAA